MWDILQRVYAYGYFGPSKTKRSSVVFVKGEDKAYWFVHVIFLIHLEIAEVTSQGE